METKVIEGNKKHMRLFQILIFIALLGLVMGGFGKYVLAPAQSSGVPQYVGPLKLVSRVEGTEALTEINKLHGTTISLRNAFIVGYSGPYGGSHMMVWVGEGHNQGR